MTADGHGNGGGLMLTAAARLSAGCVDALEGGDRGTAIGPGRSTGSAAGGKEGNAKSTAWLRQQTSPVSPGRWERGGEWAATCETHALARRPGTAMSPGARGGRARRRQQGRKGAPAGDEDESTLDAGRCPAWPRNAGALGLRAAGWALLPHGCTAEGARPASARSGMAPFAAEVGGPGGEAALGRRNTRVVAATHSHPGPPIIPPLHPFPPRVHFAVSIATSKGARPSSPPVVAMRVPAAGCPLLAAGCWLLALAAPRRG
ncbi:hypothetical protein K505DRAFT_366597 [Melanomma pulvis-pyrius CBS 109.77]|uniref:Uncharacterized protein n=1 Tax=Melanomma pulvis-pyrius CBS 109.77 TaxID=1314802 RepID=A0A6A6WWL0_9PLEO|nr:hypothetical protein K505DRAFT_366597 [Melanomma pulvis-pyrius CBS 109.77]